MSNLVQAAPNVPDTAERVTMDEAMGQFPDVDIRTSIKALAAADPYLWVATHRRLKGRPLFYDNTKEIMSFGSKEIPQHVLLRHRPFLVQPLLDSHPHKAYKKGRQIGVSELEINEVMCFLDQHPGTKYIYTFPRDTQLKDFSISRIGEALAETPAMQRLVGTPNQVYTKRIGDSFLILRSAWESGLGEGIDADGVTLDEKDRMKEGVEIAFRESLASSRYGLLRELSTPSLPGRGIDVPWQNSCQYEWFVRCTKCGMRQPIKWPDNVIQLKDIPIGTKQLEPGSYEYLCSKEKCRGRLDRRSGEWVAKFPSRSHIAGYMMPQTIAPWISATNLMQKKIDYRFIQPWMNYCLAECSVGENVLLTDEDFARCIAGHGWMTHRNNQWSRVVVGIDWGRFNWCLVIGINAFNDLPYLIGFYVCEDDERDTLGAAKKMDEFIKPFDPDIIIADSGYGKDRNSYLLKRWEHRFFACYYNASDKHSRSFKPQFTDATNRVLVDRTIALKNACHTIRERGLGLPVMSQQLQLVMQHMKALAPLLVDDGDGEMYETIDSTGDDHLAHCMGYALIGVEKVSAGWNKFSITMLEP